MGRRLILVVVALGLALTPVADVLCERSCLQPTSFSRLEAKPPCHRSASSGTGSKMSDAARGCDHDHAVLMQASAPKTKSAGIILASSGPAFIGRSVVA